MSGISDLSTFTMVRNAASSASKEYGNNVRKLSSGFNYQDFANTATKTQEILHLKSSQIEAKVFKDISTSIINRAAQYNQVIENIFDIASHYRTELQKFMSPESNAIDMPAIAKHCKERLMHELMTKDIQGRFIFGGQHSTIQPIGNLDNISLPALDQDLEASSYTSYSAEKNKILTHPDFPVTDFGVLADHPGINNLLHSLLIGEQALQKSTSPDPDFAQAHKAISLANGSIGHLTLLTSEMGHMQKFMENINQTHVQTLENSKTDLAEIIETNLFEAYQDSQIQQTLMTLLHKTSLMGDIDDFIKHLNL